MCSHSSQQMVVNGSISGHFCLNVVRSILHIVWQVCHLIALVACKPFLPPPSPKQCVWWSQSQKINRIKVDLYQVASLCQSALDSWFHRGRIGVAISLRAWCHLKLILTTGFSSQSEANAFKPINHAVTDGCLIDWKSAVLRRSALSCLNLRIWGSNPHSWVNLPVSADCDVLLRLMFNMITSVKMVHEKINATQVSWPTRSDLVKMVRVHCLSYRDVWSFIVPNKQTNPTTVEIWAKKAKYDYCPNSCVCFVQIMKLLIACPFAQRVGNLCAVGFDGHQNISGTIEMHNKMK